MLLLLVSDAAREVVVRLCSARDLDAEVDVEPCAVAGQAHQQQARSSSQCAIARSRVYSGRSPMLSMNADTLGAGLGLGILPESMIAIAGLMGGRCGPP